MHGNRTSILRILQLQSRRDSINGRLKNRTVSVERGFTKLLVSWVFNYVWAGTLLLPRRVLCIRYSRGGLVGFALQGVVMGKVMCVTTCCTCMLFNVASTGWHRINFQFLYLFQRQRWKFCKQFRFIALSDNLLKRGLLAIIIRKGYKNQTRW